jgi:hypothetical protein
MILGRRSTLSAWDKLSLVDMLDNPRQTGHPFFACLANMSTHRCLFGQPADMSTYRCLSPRKTELLLCEEFGDGMLENYNADVAHRLGKFTPQ